MSPEGVAAYEGVVSRLLREPGIKGRWDDQELWGVVASFVVALAEADDRPAFMARGLARLRDGGPSLVLVPLANVRWDGEPKVIGGGVIGRLDDRFGTRVAEVAGDRPRLDSAEGHDWVRLQSDARAQGEEGDVEQRQLVVAACWPDAQMNRALDLARRWVEDVFCVPLLFKEDLAGNGMWSLRGGHNRPGVRGLTPDRSTLSDLLAEHPRGHFELSSRALVLSREFGATGGVHWYSADPVPLEDLLGDAERLNRLGGLLGGDQAVARRIRVAARWYADAHWAEDRDDAVLALGVALDAIVGSKSALPGRVMAQRFAYLESDPSQRSTRVARYNDLYSVRSAVAHGGEPSRLGEGNFVREMADEVRWAAQRFVAFADQFSVASEADVDAAFESLTLGAATW
jgi:hypothetical protein